MDASDPKLFLTLLGLQGLWGLFLLILSFALRRMLGDLDRNTKATEDIAKTLGNLHLSIALNTVTKEEFVKVENRLFALNDKVVALETREQTRVRRQS